MTNTTQNFLGDDAQQAAARFELVDVQGLWGGRRIEVGPGGQAAVRIVDRGMVERRYELALPPDEYRALLEVFVQNDFLTIHPPDRPGIPDEARQVIRLAGAAGHTHTVEKWSGVRDERFDAVYVALVQLEAHTLGLDPIYTGPYTA